MSSLPFLDLDRLAERRAAADVGSLPRDRYEFFRAHVRPRSGSAGYGAFSFDHHEYLAGPMWDDSPCQVRMKAVQLGFSTFEIGEALRVAGALGLHVGYWITTDSFIKTFVQSKFDPLIDADTAVPSLAELVVEGDPGVYLSETARRRGKRADNTQLKLVGSGQIWFQGCQVLQDVKSIDMDLVIRDEVDELDPELAQYIEDRLAHSDYRRQVSLSQPSVPGFGIDREYEASDQKRFLLRCSGCRQWICLEDTWPHCLGLSLGVPGGKAFRCPCGGRLPFFDRRNEVRPPDRRHTRPRVTDARGHATAEWVATFPDRAISGYRLSQLIGPATRPEDVFAAWGAAQGNASRLGHFYRSTLGLAYAADRQPISLAIFDRACNPAVTAVAPPDPALLRPATAVWAGVDVGDLMYLVVGIDLPPGFTQIVWLEELTDWGLLEARLREFGVRVFGIDARPEKRSAKTLCRLFRRRGFIVYWADTVEQALFGDEIDGPETVPYLRVPRTESLDEMVSCVQRLEADNGAIRFPSQTSPGIDLARRHFQKLVKEKLADSNRQPYKDHVANHFACATAYLALARKWGPAMKLGPADPIAGREISLPRAADRFGSAW